MTGWLVVRKPTIKDIMQRTEDKSWPGKNEIVPRTLRFSSHVVKAGMKTTGKVSLTAREPIINRTRSTPEITENNTVKTTGKRSTNIGDVIMPRVRNRPGKEFVTKNKDKIDQNIVRFGAWDKESEKLETSLVPSVTLCGTPMVKT